MVAIIKKGERYFPVRESTVSQMQVPIISFVASGALLIAGAGI